VRVDDAGAQIVLGGAYAADPAAVAACSARLGPEIAAAAGSRVSEALLYALALASTGCDETNPLGLTKAQCGAAGCTGASSSLSRGVERLLRFPTRDPLKRAVLHQMGGLKRSRDNRFGVATHGDYLERFVAAYNGYAAWRGASPTPQTFHELASLAPEIRAIDDAWLAKIANGKLSNLKALAARADASANYELAAPVETLVAMFEATGRYEYLERALRLAHASAGRMFPTGSPWKIFKNGKARRYQPNQVALQDAIWARAMARASRVALTQPASVLSPIDPLRRLAVVVRDRVARRVYGFHRGPWLGAFIEDGRANHAVHVLSHPAAIAAELWRTWPTQPTYRADASTFATALRASLKPSGTRFVWGTGYKACDPLTIPKCHAMAGKVDEGCPCGCSIPDVGHAAAVVAYALEAKRAGLPAGVSGQFGDDELARLAETFKGAILAGGEVHTFIDGAVRAADVKSWQRLNQARAPGAWLGLRQVDASVGPGPYEGLWADPPACRAVANTNACPASCSSDCGVATLKGDPIKPGGGLDFALRAKAWYARALRGGSGPGSRLGSDKTCGEYLGSGAVCEVETTVSCGGKGVPTAECLHCCK
jgi:hypothetical protein